MSTRGTLTGEQEATSVGSEGLAALRGVAPSYQRAYAGWIESAKRERTREKRLLELIDALAAGTTPGMK